MAWVDRGTVNVTNSSAVVTGVGTLWLSETIAGVGFAGPDGRLYEVLSIASNTSLTLTRPYRGPTATGQKYTLPPIQGHTKAAADRLSELISLLQNEYASVLKAADLQASPNDATNGKILTVGRAFGLGSFGAANSYDRWPSASLDDVSVPAGMYYVSTEIADRPAYEPGIVWHRQAGSVAAQVYVSSEGGLLFRGRRAGVYRAWETTLNVGKYGLGGGTVSPPNGRDNVNPFGWYYQSSPVPSWGDGAFFLDMPYGPNQSAGLRLSTTPYTDDFYLNGGISGKKEYRPACKLLHDKNIVGPLGGGSVIESGANANGRWVRYADGTQICTQQTQGSAWVDIQTGNIWASANMSWSFPIAFVDTPAVSGGNVTGSSGQFWFVNGSEVGSGTRISWKIMCAYEWKGPVPMSLTAIGRWKA